MKKIAVVLVTLIVLTGCSKTKTVVCKFEEEGYSVVETMVGKKDVVGEVTIVEKTNFLRSLELYDITKEEYEGILNVLKEGSKDLKGYTYDYKIEGDSATETRKVDYNIADFDELLKIGFLSEKGDYVSFESVIKDFKDLGGTCE